MRLGTSVFLLMGHVLCGAEKFCHWRFESFAFVDRTLADPRDWYGALPEFDMPIAQ